MWIAKPLPLYLSWQTYQHFNRFILERVPYFLLTKRYRVNMKVAIVGANGKVGRLVCNKLKECKSFATPLALVRTEEQVDHFEREVGIEASLTSIEDSNVGQIAAALKGCDAVVFSAGAGGKGVERIFTVDLDGCVKTIEACEIAGIKRFIVVSAINAEDREFWWNTALRNYYIAKRTADHEVKNSKLDYTILHPGSLMLGGGTGKLTPVARVQETKKNHYAIQREDVASVIVESLLNPQKTIRKTIPLANGEQPISEFIQSL